VNPQLLDLTAINYDNIFIKFKIVRRLWCILCLSFLRPPPIITYTHTHVPLFLRS